MNMLSSLKAMLFSSTAVQPGSDASASVQAATDGTSLFATMLAGSMTETGAGVEIAPATIAPTPVIAEEAAAVEPEVAIPMLATEGKASPRTKAKVDVDAPPVAEQSLPVEMAKAADEQKPAEQADQSEQEDSGNPQPAAPSWMPVPGPINQIPVQPTANAASAANTGNTGVTSPAPAPVALPDKVSIEKAPQPTAAAPSTAQPAPASDPHPVSPPPSSNSNPEKAAAPVAKEDHAPQSTPTRRRVGWVRQEQRLAEKTPEAASQEPASAPAAPDVVAPVLNGKPMKSEALALLQIVRDQVSAKQSGASVKVGEAVSAAASSKEKSRSAQSAADVSIGAVMVDAPATPPQTATAPVQQSPLQPVSTPVAPGADISATLGAQVVDMGVSGQWIDGLARDIAGLSANGAEGRFQIHADKLGTVQVDIRQHADGAAVNLTVASEVAEQALRQDSDRLRLDAGLSAVRIADVKIERSSPVAETARPDAPGQQASQHQQSPQHQSPQASAWQHGNQDMGQPQGQGRWQARENSGFSTKPGNDPAVLNHADGRETSGTAARARYA